MKKWIEKRMRAEYRKLTDILTISAFLSGLVALFMLYIALLPALDGLTLLDTPEKVERFSQKNYSRATLPYDSATGMLGDFTISRQSAHNIRMFSGGMYMEIPLPPVTTTTRFGVWQLSGDGYTVLFCSRSTLQDTGEVRVQSIRRNPSDEIIHDFAPGLQNVYVLYAAGDPTTSRVFMAALFALAYFLWLLPRSGDWYKKTHLGKQIMTFGNYRDITREINRQAMEPLLTHSSCTILQDWIILGNIQSSGFESTYCTLLLVTALKGIEISPDEDDPELFSCTLVLDGYNPFVIYLSTERTDELRVLKERILQN